MLAKFFITTFLCTFKVYSFVDFKLIVIHILNNLSTVIHILLVYIAVDFK
jgi:hypothetical protein